MSSSEPWPSMSRPVGARTSLSDSEGSLSSVFARRFEDWVQRYIKPRSLKAQSNLIKQLVSQNQYGTNTETGRLFFELRKYLTQREFTSLPQKMQEVLDGKTITFLSDDTRQHQRALEKSAERRQPEAYRRELMRVHEQKKQQRLTQQQEAWLLERRKERIRAEVEILKRDTHKRFEDVRKNQLRLREIRELNRIHTHRFEARLFSELSSNFLSIERHVKNQWSPKSPRRIYHKKLKTRFVQAWGQKIFELSLDEEQAAAVGAVDGNVLVTARAGSGKTRVLTARALFLHKHCGVPANRIMLLAFNRRAASEMEDRLRKWLGDDIPHVMTFHALAYALVHPSQRLLFDDKDEGQKHLSKVTQQVIDEHVRNSEWESRIRSVMLEHFKTDWNRIETGGYNLSGQEFLDYRHSLRHETLKGERVSNFSQKAIANLLAEYDVKYSFDRRWNYGGRAMYADFVIKLDNQDRLYIHIADPRNAHDQNARQTLQDSICNKKTAGVLLKYDAEDLQSLGETRFESSLLSELHKHKVKHRRLSDDELWLAVRDRALGDFTKAMQNFIGRCRQRAWSFDDLIQRASYRKDDADVSNYEIEFYRTGLSIYKEYLSRLERDKLEDFNGIMLRAAETVGQGTTRFERKGNAGDIRDINYLHIDEYQDFSRSFHDLTSAMRAANPNMTVFAVGDDWQAINGFAGSDLQYFREFDEYFPEAQHLSITRNYRSRKKIVEASNALLSAEDETSKAVASEAGDVQVCLLDNFKPTRIEVETFEASKQKSSSRDLEYQIAVARITQWLAKEGEVALLNRANNPDVIFGKNLQAAQKELQHMLPKDIRENITVDTAHSFKGLESEAIVILDAVANHYPLIHPHWIFGQVFGDTLASITKAEERLFYVAVSRAQHRMIICTQSSKQSPFLDKIQSACSFPKLDLNHLQPVAVAAQEIYEVRVFNSFGVKNLLKRDGFKFVDGNNLNSPHWSRVMKATEATNEWIARAPWNDGQVRIEIYDEAGMRIWSSVDADTSALPQAEPF